MKQLEQIKNKTTGSTFYTICKGGGLRGSIRIWIERKPGQAATQVGFRFRVEPLSLEVQYFDFANSMAVKFPGVEWLGKSSRHCSLAGGASFGVYPHEVETILDLESENDISGKLFDMILVKFSIMEQELSRDEFKEFFRLQIINELNEFVSNEKTKPSGVLLNFGASSTAMKDGKEVSPSAAGFPEVGAKGVPEVDGGGSHVVGPAIGVLAGEVGGPVDLGANPNGNEPMPIAAKKPSKVLKVLKAPKVSSDQPQTL